MKATISLRGFLASLAAGLLLVLTSSLSSCSHHVAAPGSVLAPQVKKWSPETSGTHKRIGRSRAFRGSHKP